MHPDVRVVERGRRPSQDPTALILGVETYPLPNPERTAYVACVRRGPQCNRYEVYWLPLRERLNAIRIPLRETDADVALDLQALGDQAYRRGRYDQELDYRQPPHPPLNADDAVWADELLRSRGAP